MAILSNDNEFILKSNKIHDNVYDYSLVEYKNNYTKVKIICSIHGIFEQTPANHLKKRRCPFCFGKFTKTADNFIKNCISIHGDKYDYSMSNYINVSTKVKIKCKNNHIFEQTPNAHLGGQGCPKCIGFHKNNDDFIQECRKIHGDKYDYSMVKYINSTEKIKIICNKHLSSLKAQP